MQLFFFLPCRAEQNRQLDDFADQEAVSFFFRAAMNDKPIYPGVAMAPSPYYSPPTVHVAQASCDKPIACTKKHTYLIFFMFFILFSYNSAISACLLGTCLARVYGDYIFRTITQGVYCLRDTFFSTISQPGA